MMQHPLLSSFMVRAIVAASGNYKLSNSFTTIRSMPSIFLVTENAPIRYQPRSRRTITRKRSMEIIQHELHLDSPIIVGHSLGEAIALTLALEHSSDWGVLF